MWRGEKIWYVNTSWLHRARGSASPHLARPPHAPQSAGGSRPAPVRPCPSPPPPREESPSPPPPREEAPAPVRRRPVRSTLPQSAAAPWGVPQSTAATTHHRSGALNPVRRRHPVRGRPVRPPPVRRRRPVRPPPIRHRSRGHRRPPSAPLWLTPEPPSLSTVHRCPDSRGYQLLRSCNDGGKIYLLCSLCHRLLFSWASCHLPGELLNQSFICKCQGCTYD
jgi:hypothetical protein